MRDLPRGWARTTLGQLGDYINGRAFKPTEWAAKGRPIIRIQNLTGSSSGINRYDGPIEEKYIVQTDDLLISWSATLGAFFWRGEEAVLNQHIFKVRSGIDKRFHKYLVDHTLRRLQQQTHGSGMTHITRGPFNDTSVDLPPLAEQERIVAAIEEEFSRIDAGVSALARAQNRLTALRAATLSAIANDKTCSMVPFGTLVASVGAGRSFRCDTRPAGEDEWGVIKVSAMTWGRFLERENKALLPDATPNPAYEIRAGDVLVSRANTVDYVGAAVEVPPCRRRLLLSDKSLRVTARSGIEPSWLVAVLQMRGTRREIERVATGTSDSMRNISQPKLMSLSVPTAGLEDQRRFLRQLAGVDGTVAELRRRLETARLRSRALRSSVLAAAFSGRLVPQNPSDEPASILLERIRGEVAASNGRKETIRRSRTKVIA